MGRHRTSDHLLSSIYSLLLQLHCSSLSTASSSNGEKVVASSSSFPSSITVLSTPSTTGTTAGKDTTVNSSSAAHDDDHADDDVDIKIANNSDLDLDHHDHGQTSFLGCYWPAALKISPNKRRRQRRACSSSTTASTVCSSMSHHSIDINCFKDEENVQDRHRQPIALVEEKEEGETEIPYTAVNTISSSSPSLTNASTTKRISFGNCQIRTYPQVLGDHPCCLEGCPIQLGWNYQEEKSIKVDEYENDKEHDHDDKEQDHELRLLPEERKRIILSTKQFSIVEEEKQASSSLSLSSSVSSERKLFHECRKLNRKNIRWRY